MRLVPLGNRLILLQDTEGDVSRGGVHLPQGAQIRPATGVIVAVGAGKVLDDGTRIPVGFEPGEHVIFSRYAGAEVTIDEQLYLIITENDIYATYEPTERARIELTAPTGLSSAALFATTHSGVGD